MRLGLLSTAGINHMIVLGAAASDRVEVVAVASRTAERAEAYARRRGIPRTHGSYEALLADEDVEAVYIPLPNAMHHAWTMRALAAGKHVLCEKPYSRHPQEVEEAFDAADRAGVVLMEGFMYRHHPQLEQAGALLAEGAIGRLRSVAATFSADLAEPDAVRMDPELDGGALMDVGCYAVSGVRLLAGEPTRVSAEQVVGASGVDVSFHALLRCPADVVGSIEASFQGPLRQRLEAVGEAGVLTLTAPWLTEGPCTIRIEAGGTTTELAADPVEVFRAELENMADAVAGVAPPLLGRADALGQARALDALLRSAEQGRAVTL